MIEVQLTWAAMTVFIAVIGHAIFTIWSAATFKAVISTKLDNLVLAMQKIDKELEKRDTQISTTWRKIDDLANRINKIEANNH